MRKVRYLRYGTRLPTFDNAAAVHLMVAIGEEVAKKATNAVK